MGHEMFKSVARDVIAHRTKFGAAYPHDALEQIFRPGRIEITRQELIDDLNALEAMPWKGRGGLNG